jgi:hypothetical protein
MVVVGLEIARDMVRCAHMKMFWMLMTVVLAIRLRVATLILIFDGLTPDDSHSVADIIYFFLVTSIMLLGLLQAPVSSRTVGSAAARADTQYGMFVDSEDDHTSKAAQERGQGELTACWLSRMTFSWLSPLLMLGWKQQLGDEHLCPLIPDDTMSETGKKLLHAWQVEMRKQQEDPKRKAALTRSLYSVFWPLLLRGASFKIVNDIVVFTGPMLLQQLIRFVENGDENRSIADGAFIAVGLFLSKSVESIVLGQYFDVGYRLGSQARSAVTSLVYRKAFLLSAKGRQDFKLGELVSLMSVDAQRLCGTAPFLHQFWSAPIQLFVSIFLLYRTVSRRFYSSRWLPLHTREDPFMMVPIVLKGLCWGRLDLRCLQVLR